WGSARCSWEPLLPSSVRSRLKEHTGSGCRPTESPCGWLLGRIVASRRAFPYGSSRGRRARQAFHDVSYLEGGLRGGESRGPAVTEDAGGRPFRLSSRRVQRARTGPPASAPHPRPRLRGGTRPPAALRRHRSARRDQLLAVLEARDGCPARGL